MATVIRFSRHGSKKRPIFRMVVQDHRSPRDGRFIEKLGIYNPLVGAESLQIKRDRLNYWIGTGAQVSEAVRNCLKKSQSTVEGAVVSDQTPAAPKVSKPKTAKSTAKKATDQVDA